MLKEKFITFALTLFLAVIPVGNVYADHYTIPSNTREIPQYTNGDYTSFRELADRYRTTVYNRYLQYRDDYPTPTPTPEDPEEPVENPDPVVPENPESTILLPDLIVLPPEELYIRRNGSSREIRFSTTAVNKGQGPLELYGYHNAETDRTQAMQVIYRIDGSKEENQVGNFIFHEDHNHWHLEDFTAFELWTYHEDGTLNELLTTTEKISFCIIDTQRIYGDLEGSPDAARYAVCGQNALQGISVGWGDTYNADVSGQQLDITNIPDGKYAIRSVVDPGNLLQEIDDDNNTTVNYIRIKNNRINYLNR